MVSKKFVKDRRRNRKNYAQKGNDLCFGDYGLKAVTYSNLNVKQLEAGRKVISRNIKKLGKMWIRIFPDKSYTKKPVDVRMGNGKGDISFYVFFVQPGKIIYEIKGLSKVLSFRILKLASFKLPFKTIFI